MGDSQHLLSLGMGSVSLSQSGMGVYPHGWFSSPVGSITKILCTCLLSTEQPGVPLDRTRGSEAARLVPGWERGGNLVPITGQRAICQDLEVPRAQVWASGIHR